MFSYVLFVLKFEFDNAFKFVFLVALEALTLKIASQPGNVSFGNFYMELPSNTSSSAQQIFAAVA